MNKKLGDNMRLVVMFQEGTEFTGSNIVTTPVEYDSAEQFIVDFHDWCEFNKHITYFPHNSGFHELNLCPNSKDDPDFEVLTLDEWFDKYTGPELR